MANDYVAVVYAEQRTPKTDYPLRLASYLFKRYGMKAGDKLLEIGCGRGEFVTAFQDLGLECHAVERSEYSLRELKHIEIKRYFKERLPYVTYLISHITNIKDDIIRNMKEIGVLKPGGRVIILTPDWASQMKVFYEDFTHSKPYDVTSIADLLRVCGFAQAEAELFYQLPVLWRYAILKVFCKLLQILFSVPIARKFTKITGIKFFRWSVELMVLGSGIKTGVK